MTEREIKRRLTSHEVSKLVAADNMGLLPDPQMQTATICAVLANLQRGEKDKPLSAEDFLYRPRPEETPDLEAGYEQRKQQAQHGRNR